MLDFLFDLKNIQTINKTENPRLLKNNTKILEFRIILHEYSSILLQRE